MKIKAKTLLERPSPRKMQLGRPRKRCIEGVDKAFEKRGITIREVEESKKYEKRGKWRNCIQDSQTDK